MIALEGVGVMPITYKIDIIKKLKDAGYSTYRIRKEKLLAESTLQSIRDKKSISWENVATICGLLNCQPGDLLMYLDDEPEAEV
jgi:putative transcriptional regulator